MNGLRRTAACTLFILLLGGVATAQRGMWRPNFRGVWNPVVGTGAQYDVQTSDGKKITAEITILGKETVEGKDGYWMEVSWQIPEMGEMISKTLLVRDADSSRTARVIIQMPGRPPMEMPLQGSPHSHQWDTSDFRKQAQDLGSETITTPAGTFLCEHYRASDGSNDAWVSQKVSPFALVKMQGKDSTMVLARIITDAKDKITGTPQPFNPMMMQQPPQRPQQ